MNSENILSNLAEWSVWGPSAESALYVFLGAMAVFVVSCMVAQVLEDKLHPSRTGRSVTLAR